MEIKDKKKLAVIGAAGKMGRGIALLLCQLTENPNWQETITSITLVDRNLQALEKSLIYIKDQLVKSFEKRGEKDPEHLSNLCLKKVSIHTSIKASSCCDWIFEAIVENIEAKKSLYLELEKNSEKKALYFTNTSSIPISLIEKEANIKGRIVGFHFYNPPFIQKLLELIYTENTPKEIQTLSFDLVKTLKKIPIISKDIAGFIGNGHFLQEVFYSCGKVEKQKYQPNSIFTINQITETLLLRPMGIFQLIDYVGIDVVLSIARIMSQEIKSLDIIHPLLVSMVEKKHIGGQTEDGVQKPGFFTYAKGKITHVIDLEKDQYIPVEKSWYLDLQKKTMATKHSFKTLLKDDNKKESIQGHLRELFISHLEGDIVAQEYLKQSNKIAHKLVEDKIADQKEDVNRVLTLGFYHPYGPLDNFLDHLIRNKGPLKPVNF